MNEIQIFQYNGNPITFNRGGSVMVNATEMARPFGKSATHWLRNQSTQEFVKELAKLRNRNLDELVQVTYGGNENGTWMHEDVAMEFARWLSPSFAIWCNDRIKELLTKGVTTTMTDDEMILQSLSILQKRLDASNEERRRLEAKNKQQEERIELQSEELKKQAPKVAYHDEVLTSTSTYNTTNIAKEFGMGAPTLNKILHEKGIQYKMDGQWLLYHKYQGLGYTRTVTNTYDNGYGEVHTRQQTVWTERGRQFIHQVMKADLLARAN